MSKPLYEAGAELEAAWNDLKKAVLDEFKKLLAHLINGVNYLLEKLLKWLEK